MRFDSVEQFRKPHPLGFEHVFGDRYGWFHIRSEYDNKVLMCMAHEDPKEGGWEHVSVSKEGGKTPLWREMCQIKDLFWTEEDCVVQYHPPKKDYINLAKNCLHLWKPVGMTLPRPDKILVGI